jgi:outer membrane protein OmpA-like peptidoglycan-associated protein
MRRSKSVVALCVALSIGLAGCATDEFGNPRPLTDAEKGVLIGSAAGAVLGNVGSNHHRGRNAIIGAIGGGIAGGMVGNYMDNQKRDLEKVLASERQSGAIEIDKLPQNVLRITMTNQTAFEIDSARIKSGFYPAMDKIANVLVRYGKTQLTVVGYTDNTGSAKHNQALSESRAEAVQRYLAERGVVPQRLSAMGKGESEPRASNASATGRQLNRRAEILVEPVVEGQASS